MTGRSTLYLLLFVAALAVAVFVWPTRYQTRPAITIDGARLEQRVDRFTGTLERKPRGGDWYTVFVDTSRIDNREWTPGAREVDAALGHGEDIKKMQDATNDAMDKLREQPGNPID